MRRMQLNRSIVLAGVLPLILSFSSCDFMDNSKTEGETPEAAEPTAEAPQYVIPDAIVLDTPEEPSEVELDTSNWAIKPPFYAAGQEPFWRLELNDGWFVFQRLGLPEIEAQINTPKRVEGADEFELEGLKISIKAGACTNAQANEPVRGAITLVHDEVSYQGCVYRGATQDGEASENVAETGETSNWTNEIGIYAIEVDECLKALDGIQEGASNRSYVSAMNVQDDGKTAFVLRTRNGNDYLCYALTTGGVDEIEALSKSEREAWMNVSGRFMRVESGPPPRACLDAEAVIVDGHLTGYLLPRNCRP